MTHRTTDKRTKCHRSDYTMYIGARSFDLSVGGEDRLRGVSKSKGTKRTFMVTVHRFALCLWHGETIYSFNIDDILQGSN